MILMLFQSAFCFTVDTKPLCFNPEIIISAGRLQNLHFPPICTTHIFTFYSVEYVLIKIVCQNSYICMQPFFFLLSKTGVCTRSRWVQKVIINKTRSLDFTYCFFSYSNNAYIKCLLGSIYIFKLSWNFCLRYVWAMVLERRLFLLYVEYVHTRISTPFFQWRSPVKFTHLDVVHQVFHIHFWGSHFAPPPAYATTVHWG